MEWTREYPQADGAMPSERRRHYGRFVHIAVIVLVIAMALFLVYDLNGKSLDLSDREVRLIVTDSMDAEPQPYDIPTIPKMSLVMIHDLDIDGIRELEKGDVLAFNSLGLVFTHRIVEKHESYFITKGDNAQTSETVRFSDAIGKVVGVNHPLGVVMDFLRNNGMLVIAAVVVLMVSFVAVRWILSWDRDQTS